MIKAGDAFDKRDELISKMEYLSLEDRKVEMSPDEKRIKLEGDIGQAERLRQQKKQYGAK